MAFKRAGHHPLKCAEREVSGINRNVLELRKQTAKLETLTVRFEFAGGSIDRRYQH